MNRTLTVALLTGALLAAPAVPALAATSAPAHSHIWWDTATCRAYAAWELHPSARAWRVADGDSRHAAVALRTDFELWRADRARHAPAATLARDAGYPAADCNPYGQ